MWEPGSRVLDERFRIVSVLEPGSLTEVYVAEQLALSRQVTLRVFRAGPGAQQGSGDQLDAEVRRLAAVDHPAVVRVLDSGRAEGTPFVVSELAEGPRLAGELKNKEPLPPERAIELLTQLADGLAALHDQGLLHGELRPQTVVVAKSARGEQARLLDFGLARLIEAQSPGGQTTVIGTVVGPVDHLAPEQLAGAPASVPGDLYAFGVLAYQVFSGVLPSRATPKPLAEAAPHLADQVELCAWVMRCLEPDAARRPASALELAKLPRPTEPTIFLETMQRPPPVPVALAPAAPAAAAAPPPEPLAPPPLPAAAVSPAAGALPPPPAPRLLASVETLVMPVPIPAAPLGAPALPVAAPRPRRWPWAAAALAVVFGVAVGGVVFVNGAARREARTLIERRQPAQALELIGKTQRRRSEPDRELLALKVAALHLTAAHSDEAAAFKALPDGTREALEPLVLTGLVEDFSRKEDPALRALLGGLPKRELHQVLEGFAQEPLSPRQWGALRYLELEAATGSLGVVGLYSASLESNDCAVRRAAARRLGQLMDDASEAALGRLRDAPREGAEKSCGQDEAQAALQALKKSR